jgi:hypothetical protein
LWALGEDEFYICGSWNIGDIGLFTGQTFTYANDIEMLEIITPNDGKCWIHRKHAKIV